VFFLTSDDVARLSIGSQEVIDKKSSGLATRAGACKLPPNQPVPITVEYTHSSTGPASMHLYWLSTSAREVLQLSRLIKVFEIYDNEEQALAT